MHMVKCVVMVSLTMRQPWYVSIMDFKVSDWTKQITLLSSFIYLSIYLFTISPFNYLSFSFIVGFVTSQYVNRTYNNYNYYYSNFTCPPSAVNLTSCSNNVNSVSSCSGYGGPAVVQCVTCKLIYNIYQFICLVYFEFLYFIS